MIVVGSGVTGAEFASAYNGLGAAVTLVSSRDRVLPGEDIDAANVIEAVFTRRGMKVMGNSRMGLERTGDGVRVTLTDGRTVDGWHCLWRWVRSPTPRASGSRRSASRSTTPASSMSTGSPTRTSGIYAAGDVTES